MHVFFTSVRRIVLWFSVVLCLGSWWQLVNSPTGSILILIGESELSRQITSLSTSITNVDLDEEVMRNLDVEPRNWVVIDSLLDIAEDESLTLSPATIDQLDAAREQDGSLHKLARDCARCAWDSGSCEMSIAMACGITIELTPIGDVAGLARAGRSYLAGEEIDQVDAGLSVIGLTATALTISSAGSSTTIKVGAGLLRFIHKSGNLSPALTQVLVKAAKEGIGWRQLPKARSLEDVVRLTRKKALAPAIELSDLLGQLVDNTGINQSISLLKETRGMSELRAVTEVGKTWRSKTSGYFELLGRNRVLRTITRYADEVYGILAGFIGLIASLIWTFLTVMARRSLRWKMTLSKSNRS